MVWGELEFLLPGEKVVRLHGTEWQETQRFYHYLQQAWQTWSLEMSAICAGVLTQLKQEIDCFGNQDRWIKRSELQALHATIEKQFAALPLPLPLPLPLERLNDFDDCRDLYHFCQRWLEQGEAALCNRNRDWSAQMLKTHHDFFATVENSPLNAS